MPKIKKVPFEEHVANTIIKALEDGTVPWIKPWKGSELNDIAPINLTTNKAYNGINFVNLAVVAMNKGYSDPRWLTFNQAKSIGATVKKGEKASLVKFYKFTELKEVLDEDGKTLLDDKGKPLKEEIKLENPKVIYHYVFNAMQCENVPELIKDETKEATREFNAIKAAENILQNSNADIRHIKGNRAYYSLTGDYIVLPTKEQFLDAGEEIGYYSTALHELGHWTGHESRLNRDMEGSFGTASYAKEELRAEIASFMMCSKLGLDFDPEQHYAYIGSWVKILKEEPKEILKASRDAAKITNYIIDLQKEKTMHQEKDILDNTINRGNPYELSDGRVIMEHLKGGEVDNIQSQGLYIFSGEPGNMKPITKLSNSEAEKLIKQDFLARLSTKADNLGCSVMDNEDKQSSFTIFDDSGEAVKTGSYIQIDKELDKLPNLRYDSMTQLLDRELKKFESVEAKEHNSIDKNAKELNIILTNSKIDINEQNNKSKINKQLEELTNTIIYAQSILLEDNLQPYTKSVLSSTISMLKDTQKILEINLNKEPNYAKEIEQNHQKLIQQEDIFTQKTYLSVPYKEKDKAKSAGTKWDSKAKSWYAPKGASKEKLKPWLYEQNISTNQNPAVEFKEVLEQNGFIVDGLPILDGKIHRIDIANKPKGNKSGWYYGFSDGRPNAIFGDYTKGQDRASTGLKWKSISSEFKTEYSQEKAAQIKKENRVKKEQALKELNQAYLQTANKLETEFNNASNTTNKHPYLVAKGVKNYGLKIDTRGNLLMPLKDIDGKFWAVQRIGKPNSKSEKSFKMIGVLRTKEEKSKDIKYPTKMDGTFFIIGEKSFNNSKTIAIVEGYSTGATLYEAINIPTVVAVHSGNLENVAKAIAKKYPNKSILIAGDNDLTNELNGKENIGKLKAQSLAVKGEVVLPSFTKEELSNKASDWNDLAKSRGLKEVKKQIDIALKKLQTKEATKTQTKEATKTQTKIQEQNQSQNKQRRREVVRKQALGIGK